MVCAYHKCVYSKPLFQQMYTVSVVSYQKQTKKITYHICYKTFQKLYTRYSSMVVLFVKVCRNISEIRLCMETGRMVILLNLENLYESLYDVLNQVNNTINCDYY